MYTLYVYVGDITRKIYSTRHPKTRKIKKFSEKKFFPFCSQDTPDPKYYINNQLALKSVIMKGTIFKF